jgi:hypothetical protein
MNETDIEPLAIQAGGPTHPTGRLFFSGHIRETLARLNEILQEHSVSASIAMHEDLLIFSDLHAKLPVGQLVR